MCLDPVDGTSGMCEGALAGCGFEEQAKSFSPALAIRRALEPTGRQLVSVRRHDADTEVEVVVDGSGGGERRYVVVEKIGQPRTATALDPR